MLNLLYDKFQNVYTYAVSKQINLNYILNSIFILNIIFYKVKYCLILYNRNVARELRDSTPNSYAKKLDSKIDAENYIKNFNFKIVDRVGNTISDVKGVKRKRLEIPHNPICSVAEHLNRVSIICYILY